MEETISKEGIRETAAAVEVSEKDFLNTEGKVSPEYDKLSDVADLIEPFKRFYLREKPFHAKRGDLVRAFKEKVLEETGRSFNLYPNGLYRIMDKLDKELAKNPKYDITKDPRPKERDVVQHNRQFTGVQANARRFTPATLEDGTMSLAESLLKDAADLLEESNESVDDDEEVRIKKKGHVLNVFRHVASTIQKGQLIDLKRKKDLREGTGFILDLIAKAQAGELTAEGMELMKGRVVHEESLVMADGSDEDENDEGLDLD